MVKLIIAEKPKAAKKIAQALGNVRTQKGGKSYYYQVDGVVVAPAVGHVYGLVPGREGWDYPIFDVVWEPSYKKKGFEYTRSYIKNLKELGKEADEIIIATDYDVEGAVIGYNILNLAMGRKDLGRVKRMKFSTLTPGELRRAFNDAHAHNKFEKGMVWAGLMRHYLDWYWGINLSRALTQAYKTTGSFRVLSTGRVQGPTLKILADREREIRSFDSSYYYKLFAMVKGFLAEGPEVEDVAKALKLFASLKPPARVEEVKKSRSRINPPPPFNLTDMQTEASRVMKYTPSRTLKLAQKLYEDGLISYPRTSSQKLPKELDTKALLTKLSGAYPFAKKFAGRKCREGKKTDPAHPAIYPTGDLPGDREPAELKLYDLVVRRFIASFGDPAERESTRIALDISGLEFLMEGRRTTVAGFTEFYPARLEEKQVPAVKKGESLPVEYFQLNREQKRPPKRFTAAGLLKQMERLNIGTKATRAGIIETLYNREYIEDKSIRVTDLGLSVVDALESVVPDIVSVDLTRAFEEKMEKVHEGERDMEEVLQDAKKRLSGMLESFKSEEVRVGRMLSKGAAPAPKAQETAPAAASKPAPAKQPAKPKGMFADGKYVGDCECGAKVYALRSRNDKRYARCSGCDKTWGLPQRGTMKILPETCKKCKLRIIDIKRKDAQFRLCMEHGFI
jgi:DNA topoisomerase I